MARGGRSAQSRKRIHFSRTFVFHLFHASDDGVALHPGAGNFSGGFARWCLAGLVFSAFWFVRLLVQWFVFPHALWRGKPKETTVHDWMTVAWFLLAALFAACALWQRAWLR